MRNTNKPKSKNKAKKLPIKDSTNPKNKRLKVVFEANSKPIDIAIANAMLTQLMVTITQVGLRHDGLINKDAIINEEKEYGNE